MIKQRIYLSIIVLSFIFIPCFAQNQKNDMDRIINESVLCIIKTYEDSIKKGTIKQVGNNKYYLLKDNIFLSLVLSEENTELNCKAIYANEIPFKEFKKGALCISCNFLVVTMDTIEIRFVMNNTKAKKRLRNKMRDTRKMPIATKRNWNLSNTRYYNEWESEYKFVYKYSCDTQEWEKNYCVHLFI